MKKEILGWILNYQASTFQLPPCRLVAIKAFPGLPPTRRHIAVPKLCWLVGKMRSMHLAVPGAIGHFYYIQEALTKAETRTQDYLPKVFHWKIFH